MWSGLSKSAESIWKCILCDRSGGCSLENLCNSGSPAAGRRCRSWNRVPGKNLSPRRRTTYDGQKITPLIVGAQFSFWSFFIDFGLLYVKFLANSFKAYEHGYSYVTPSGIIVCVWQKRFISQNPSQYSYAFRLLMYCLFTTNENTHTIHGR